MHSAPHTQPHDPTPGGSDPEAVAAILAANPDGHEHRDIALSGIVVFAVAFVVIMASVLAGLYVVLIGMNKVSAILTAGPRPLDVKLVPPEPRLQPEEGLHESLPYQDMAALRSYEETILASYGWVNREHTIVRIPIDQAMAEVVAHGVPATLPAVGLADTNQHYDPNATQNPLPRNMP